ncbi:MAG TPA: N-acetylmuramoyl-L-alanine amidase [Thermodesulfobacteriota bacterium]|nr:N-acetylmuramoyl-L-alanine amidase [Thermodesulfobacteriota bacterium]
MKIKGILFVVLIFLFVFPAWGKVDILDIRYWSAPEYTRIVVDLTGPAYYDLFELTEPNRVVIDLKEANTLLSNKEFIINDQVISKVRWGYFTPGTLRVVVDLVKSAETKVFTLKKFYDKPDRLVIDIFRSDLGKKEEEKRAVFQKKSRGTYIVVIDPGHGGEDPGAIGKSGVKEKTIALGIAKKLRDAINRERNVKAFLTRENDYFIPLRRRWRIAKEYNADLFISIHVNAGFNRNKKGAEVYCLSLGGASQEAARILADQENSSDLIGGVDLASCPDGVDSILVSMEQTRTINDGLILGKITLEELKNVHSINFPEPLQAGFAVLRAPDIPSILVEVGYLSNPQEEKLLSTHPFQTKIAEAIKKGAMLSLQQIGCEVTLLK